MSVIQLDSLTAHEAVLDSARRVLETECEGLKSLSDSLSNGQSGGLGEAFLKAVHLIFKLKGRLIITGMGKSGHVGQKMAATFASTGTPSQFVHPAEASHGDLGMITEQDAVIAISNSGEASELSDIIAYTRRFSIPLLAITAKPASTLGQAADLVLALPPLKEACPNGLAPTTSTTVTMAYGDILAVALMEQRGFGAADFKKFHPGGKLGQQLKKVSDLMHPAAETPLVPVGTSMQDAILVMTEKAFGCVGITDTNGQLAGVVTDGDLRRHMGDGLLSNAVEDVMTADPQTITPTQLASEALGIMNARSITILFVCEPGAGNSATNLSGPSGQSGASSGKPVGILHMHDLLRAGLV